MLVIVMKFTLKKEYFLLMEGNRIVSENLCRHANALLGHKPFGYLIFIIYRNLES